MDWQYILKSGKEHPIYGEELKSLKGRIIENVKFFDPNVDVALVEQEIAAQGSAKSEIERLEPFERSLEFMKPIKNDIKLQNPRIAYPSNYGKQEDSLIFYYDFELNGEKCRSMKGLKTIGYRSHLESGEILIKGDEPRDNCWVCIVSSNIMTNGDFLTAVVLSVKNNNIPNILNFVTYVFSLNLIEGIRDFGRITTLYNTQEWEVKLYTLKRLYYMAYPESSWPVRHMYNLFGDYESPTNLSLESINRGLLDIQNKANSRIDFSDKLGRW